VARARFGYLLVAGRRLERAIGGAERRALLELGLRRACGSAKLPMGLGGWEKEWAREFTVWPLMANRGGSGHRRIAHGWRAPALFIGG
jgi:hypothetical protein